MLSQSLSLICIYILEEMATHSSILAWKTPWTEEPGGLQFMGSQRVRHDWVMECVHVCMHVCARAHTHTHTHTFFFISFTLRLTLGGWIWFPLLCSRALFTHSECNRLHPPRPVLCSRAHQPSCFFPQDGGIQPLTCTGVEEDPQDQGGTWRNQAGITRYGDFLTLPYYRTTWKMLQILR